MLSFIIVLVCLATIFRHRKLFMISLNRQNINEKIGKMYDGTQEIFIINDYKSAKVFCNLKVERTYPYLGYVFNKLLKYSIGAHTGNEWLMMKKPLTQFFNTESVRNHFTMICEKSDLWIKTFDSKIDDSNFSDGITLQNLGLDKLSISIMSTIIYGNLSQDQLDELYELSLLHNKMMYIMATDMKLRCPITNKFCSKNKTIVNEFWKRWCDFHDNIKKNKDQNVHHNDTLYNTLTKSEIYMNNELKLYQTLYEITLFNLDIMIDSFANLLWNVASNSECQQLMLDEIESNDIYSFDGINNLEYIDNVICESARLNPGVVMTFAETLLNDATIFGVYLKKGSKVTLNTRNINRDPEIWNEPDIFCPTRFNKENKHKFHRFGLGPRKCLGNVYANYILKIGLSKLIQKYTFSLNVKEPIQKNRKTIVNLSNYDIGNKIIFEKRFEL